MLSNREQEEDTRDGATAGDRSPGLQQPRGATHLLTYLSPYCLHFCSVQLGVFLVGSLLVVLSTAYFTTEQEAVIYDSGTLFHVKHRGIIFLSLRNVPIFKKKTKQNDIDLLVCFLICFLEKKKKTCFFYKSGKMINVSGKCWRKYRKY